MFLSDAEVAELTGRKTKKAQAEWLKRNNVKFYENRERIVVPKGAVEKLNSRPYDPFDLKPSISDISSGKAGKFFNRSEHGIYLLWDGNEIVYVGRTTNLFSRATNHQVDKQFDRIQFVKMPRDRQDIYEMELIKELRPKYNVHGVGSFYKRPAAPELA
jgi:hypothetical protein